MRTLTLYEAYVKAILVERASHYALKIFWTYPLANQRVRYLRQLAKLEAKIRERLEALEDIDETILRIRMDRAKRDEEDWLDVTEKEPR